MMYMEQAVVKETGVNLCSVVNGEANGREAIL